MKPFGQFVRRLVECQFANDSLLTRCVFGPRFCVLLDVVSIVHASHSFCSKIRQGSRSSFDCNHDHDMSGGLGLIPALNVLQALATVFKTVNRR